MELWNISEYSEIIRETDIYLKKNLKILILLYQTLCIISYIEIFQTTNPYVNKQI